jgi:hypothetical protein
MPIHVGSRAIGLATGHVLHSEVEIITGDGVHGVKAGMAKLVGPDRRSGTRESWHESRDQISSRILRSISSYFKNGRRNQFIGEVLENCMVHGIITMMPLAPVIVTTMFIEM